MIDTHALHDARSVSDPAGVDNPYWMQVRTLPGDDIALRFDRTWMPRWTGREDGAHAGPAGIVEIGAGTGYWAWQLAQRGVDVVAYDQAPPNVTENRYHRPREPARTREPAEDFRRDLWHPVRQGDTNAARNHPDRTLLLCWPPYSTPMARHALDAYTGDTVIYIGEGAGGCTGDSDFHERLETHWTEVAEHVGVQWWGIHDRITVYRRQVRLAKKTPADPWD